MKYTPSYDGVPPLPPEVIDAICAIAAGLLVLNGILTDVRDNLSAIQDKLQEVLDAIPGPPLP